MANGLGQTVLSTGDIELPAVPGTGDDATIQLPLSQWSSGVGTDTIQGVQCSVDVEECDHAASGGELVRGSHRDFRQGSDTDLLNHVPYVRRASISRQRRRSAQAAQGSDPVRPRLLRRLLWFGFDFQRRCTQKYCSGARRTTRSRAVV